eukprot:Tbor_TRINITY_DN5390_c1_g6::TRINITY_DN5390_c1_g6_i2::g.5147::m.5147
MSILATPDMAEYCLKVIKNSIEGQPPPPPLSSVPPEAESPIFVSLKDACDNKLRGCIGSFSSLPLRKQLIDYSNFAAFNDSRFNPVTMKILKGLKCTVCLLHTFEGIHETSRVWDDWEIGKHGLCIEFKRMGKEYRGTFLPNVIGSEGWTKIETLFLLHEKAGMSRSVCRNNVTKEVLQEGLQGKSSFYEDTLKLIRYQESTASANYDNIALA